MDDDLRIRPDETMQEHADRLLQTFCDRNRPAPEDQLRREWRDELASLSVAAVAPGLVKRTLSPADYQRIDELRAILAGES